MIPFRRGHHHNDYGSTSSESAAESTESWPNILLVVVLSIALIFVSIDNGVTTFKFFKQMFSYQAKQFLANDKIWKITKSLASATIIILNIQLYLFYTWLVLIIFNLVNEESIEGYTFKILIEFIANCGFAGLRFFHLYRLKISFQNSIFELSKFAFNILLTLLIISFFLALFASITTIFMIGFNLDQEYYDAITDYGYGISFLLQSIIDLIITVIFCRKLFSLTIQNTDEIDFMAKQRSATVTQRDKGAAGLRNDYYTPLMDEPDLESPTSPILEAIGSHSLRSKKRFLSDTQVMLLETAAKQTVLISIACIVTLLISGLYFASLTYDSIEVVAGVAWILSAAIINKTLWLSFAFAQDNYKYQCKCVQKCCLEIYAHCAHYHTEKKVISILSPRSHEPEYHPIIKPIAESEHEHGSRSENDKHEGNDKNKENKGTDVDN